MVQSLLPCSTVDRRRHRDALVSARLGDSGVKPEVTTAAVSSRVVRRADMVLVPDFNGLLLVLLWLLLGRD